MHALGKAGVEGVSGKKTRDLLHLTFGAMEGPDDEKRPLEESPYVFAIGVGVNGEETPTCSLEQD